MIHLTAFAVSPPGMPRLVPGAEPQASRFALAFGALGLAAADVVPSGAQPGDLRQAAASPGKSLPLEAAGDEAGTDADPADAEAKRSAGDLPDPGPVLGVPYAWFAAPVPAAPAARIAAAPSAIPGTVPPSFDGDGAPIPRSSPRAFAPARAAETSASAVLPDAAPSPAAPVAPGEIATAARAPAPDASPATAASGRPASAPAPAAPIVLPPSARPAAPARPRAGAGDGAPIAWATVPAAAMTPQSADAPAAPLPTPRPAVPQPEGESPSPSAPAPAGPPLRLDGSAIPAAMPGRTRIAASEPETPAAPLALPAELPPAAARRASAVVPVAPAGPASPAVLPGSQAASPANPAAPAPAFAPASVAGSAAPAATTPPAPDPLVLAPGEPELPARAGGPTAAPATLEVLRGGPRRMQRQPIDARDAAPDAPARQRPVPLVPAPFPPLTVSPNAAPAAPLETVQPPLPRTTSAASAPALPTAPATPLPQDPAAPAQPQPAIDTRRHEWVALLAERVEAMRDAAPLRDTRIRLAPDMLGNVDVAIRQEGDRIHVHLAAENPAARQLLSEAQPRLVEIAEARGLRLGQTSVDGGTAGQGSPGGQPQFERRQPLSPSRVAADSSGEAPDDARIA